MKITKLPKNPYSYIETEQLIRYILKDLNLSEKEVLSKIEKQKDAQFNSIIVNLLHLFFNKSYIDFMSIYFTLNVISGGKNYSKEFSKLSLADKVCNVRGDLFILFRTRGLKPSDVFYFIYKQLRIIQEAKKLANKVKINEIKTNKVNIEKIEAKKVKTDKVKTDKVKTDKKLAKKK